ncbi:MAG TPA: isocitrate/isopropylmalate family dehydrogenase, partial [Rhodanobacter sp.]
VHGSAPDIAGKGIANPCALLLAAADMLDYLDMVAKGNELRQAIRDTMTNDRESVTPDLGGKGSTSSFADAIVKRIKG